MLVSQTVVGEAPWTDQQQLELRGQVGAGDGLGNGNGEGSQRKAARATFPIRASSGGEAGRQQDGVSGALLRDSASVSEGVRVTPAARRIPWGLPIAELCVWVSVCRGEGQASQARAPAMATCLGGGSRTMTRLSQRGSPRVHHDPARSWAEPSVEKRADRASLAAFWGPPCTAGSAITSALWRPLPPLSTSFSGNVWDYTSSCLFPF